MKIGVYSGTFDPITNGHLSVLERSARVFDKVYVAIASDSYKDTLFTLEERVDLVSKAVRHLPNVIAESFEGLLVDFAKEVDAIAIVRGLRVISDFEYEMQMAAFNKHLCEGIDTVYFTADSRFSFVSSSMIRNIASLHGDVAEFVPKHVMLALEEKYNR